MRALVTALICDADAGKLVPLAALAAAKMLNRFAWAPLAYVKIPCFAASEKKFWVLRAPPGMSSAAMLAKKNSLSLTTGPPALTPKSFRWYLGFTELPQLLASRY